MSPQEFQKRQQRAEDETLIIREIEDGFRVHSPSFPSRSYIVRGGDGFATCTCPDFEHHGNDPEWQCKHIIVVLNRTEEPRDRIGLAETPEPDHQLPPKPEPAASVRTRTPRQKNGGAQMVLKRSVSPDGRIDSLSVEFACPVDRLSVEEVRSSAVNTMELQEKIVRSFLDHRGDADRAVTADQRDEVSDGAVPARMLDIAGMNGKWGRRLFINVQTNGSTLKLFGNRKQLAEYVTMIGFPNLAERIDEGVLLNVPCRVTTKPSADGRFVNIDKILPASQPQRAAR